MEREKEVENFVKNYKVKKIDLKKFKDSKENKEDKVFSKNEIMSEFDWKNGTFYNRFNRLKKEKFDFESKYIKVKEIGDKTEKLLFSYDAFLDFLELYFVVDLKCNDVSSNCQYSVKNASNDVSKTSQNNSKLTDKTENIEVEKIINLYKDIIKQKDEVIDSLQNQIQELTDIIKVKEQRELEKLRVEAIQQQKTILINDEAGNKRQSLFARLFKRKNKKEAEN